MRVASAAHRNHSKKGTGTVEVSNERSKRESSSANISFREEYEDKVEQNNSSDEDYNEPIDHLDIFPPAAYRKGDIELGVLMSG